MSVPGHCWKPVFNYVARNVCIRKQQKPNCLASQVLEWIDIFYIWHREGRVQSKRQSYLARYRNKHVSYQERQRQPGPWDSYFLATKLLYRRHFQYVCVEWPSHCVQLVNHVHGCMPRRQVVFAQLWEVRSGSQQRKQHCLVLSPQSHSILARPVCRALEVCLSRLCISWLCLPQQVSVN